MGIREKLVVQRQAEVASVVANAFDALLVNEVNVIYTFPIIAKSLYVYKRKFGTFGPKYWTRFKSSF